ncbi:hypothetical protein COTS27_00246 [Spirochaetota bacterium]|nr:hypothetical protein COTS27_00246 [Spirochaetota bacterium]
MNSNVGGLVGENYNGTITNAYAIGSVSGVDSNVGLFIGFNASGTPLVATGSGVTASYFSTGATLIVGGTAQTDKKGVGSDTATITTVNLTARTIANLQSGTTYVGWDANNIWVFASGQYPRLKAVVCANRQFVSPVPTDCMDL